MTDIINPGLFDIGMTENPNGMIAGTTFYENVPASQRFMVLNRLNGDIVASGKSRDDGTFTRFVSADFVVNNAVTVISFDDTGTYNAQVADHINAVL